MNQLNIRSFRTIALSNLDTGDAFLHVDRTDDGRALFFADGKRVRWFTAWRIGAAFVRWAKYWAAPQ